MRGYVDPGRGPILPVVAALLVLLCACEIDQDQAASVFHGRLELPPGDIHWAGFLPDAGDTLFGDMNVMSGGTLGRLLVLDRDNFESFNSGRPYTALYRQDDAHQVSLAVRLRTSRSHFLVFANTDSATVTVWARMILE